MEIKGEKEFSVRIKNSFWTRSSNLCCETGKFSEYRIYRQE